MEDHLQRRIRMHHNSSHHHLLRLHPNQWFLADHPLTTLHPQQPPRQTVMHLLLAHSLLLRRVLHLHVKSHHNQTLMRHNHTVRALVYPSNCPRAKLRLHRRGSQGQALLRLLLKAPFEPDLQAVLRAVLNDPLQTLDQVQHSLFGRHQHLLNIHRVIDLIFQHPLNPFTRFLTVICSV